MHIQTISKSYEHTDPFAGADLDGQLSRRSTGVFVPSCFLHTVDIFIVLLPVYFRKSLCEAKYSKKKNAEKK